MVVLPPLSYIVLVHGQCLTSLIYHHNIGIPRPHHEVLKVWDQIWQDLGSLSCDMSSNRWQDIYVLPSIPCILWVHVQGLASLYYHQYNQIPPINTMKKHANQHAIIWVVSVVMWWITGHRCVATHSIDLLCIGEVLQAWDIISTVGSHTSTLWSTQPVLIIHQLDSPMSG